MEIHPGGRFEVGKNVSILKDTLVIVHEGDTMRIDDDVFISENCLVSGNVTIGKNTLVALGTKIIAENHVFDDATRPIRLQGGEKRPIVIDEDVWIGASCVLLPGAIVSAHSIVAANSVVKGTIPAWSINAGSPAKTIKFRKHHHENSPNRFF